MEKKKAKMMTIYSIGHSNRSFEEFVSILKRYRIKQVVDVRRFPMSKVVPHFNRDVLEDGLQKHKIKYVYMGDVLGGFRKYGYKDYVKTQRFMRALLKLVEISEKLPTVIMCTEALWFKCHRRYIADELVKLGWEVVHILAKDRTQRHKVR